MTTFERFIRNPTPAAAALFAYYKWNGSTNDEVWTGTLDGATHTQITSAGLEAWSPKVSPDGTKIVMLRSSPTVFGPTGIAVCNADGSGITQIASGSAGNELLGVTWDPTSTKVVFTSGTDRKVEVINADGTGRTILVTDTVEIKRPVFNYDGTKIAYFQRAGTPYNLRVMNADGSGNTSIRAGALPNQPAGDPAWANASNKIAFIASSDNSVRTINSDGTGEATISTSGTWASLTRDAWVADDSAVIVPRFASLAGDLYSMPVNGSGETFLSQRVFAVATEQYQPHVFGNRIYFTKSVAGTATFVSTLLDGTDQRTEDTPGNLIQIEGDQG